MTFPGTRLLVAGALGLATAGGIGCSEILGFQPYQEAGGSPGGGGSEPSSGGAGQGASGGGQTMSAGGGGGGTVACEVATSECTECLVELCGEELCDCFANTECLDLQTCYQEGGPDPSLAWYEVCWQQHKEGIVAAELLRACGVASCAVCGFTPQSPCFVCQIDACPDEMASCLSNPECVEYASCAADCETSTDMRGCLNNCQVESPAGASSWQALDACTQVSCASTCP